MSNSLPLVSAVLWLVVLVWCAAQIPRFRGRRAVTFPLLVAVVSAVQSAQAFIVFSQPGPHRFVAHSTGLLTDILAVAAIVTYHRLVTRLQDSYSEREALHAGQNKAREAAEEARKHASDVLDRVSDSFVSLDREWRYTYVSKQAGVMLAREPETLLGKNLWTEFGSSIGEEFANEYRRAAETQKPIFFEARYASWDRWYENRVFPSPQGISIFFHDITERKRGEEQLQEAHSRLKTAIAGTDIGFWDWDIASGHVAYSDEWKAHLGYLPAEIGESFQEWESRVHPEDHPRMINCVQSYLEGKRPEFAEEARLRHKDGSYRWILTRGNIRRDTGGKPQSMHGCHLDITHRKTVEEALQHSQEELRALAAHLHSVREEEATRISRELHDQLGQILTALKIDLQYVGERFEDPAASEQVRTRIDRAVELTDETIQSVRRLCLELRPALLDQLGLASAMEWQVRDFEQRTGISCDLSIASDLPLLPPQLATALFRITQEVLTNVARHADATQATIGLSTADGRAHLMIRDNGRGFSLADATISRRLGLVGIKERAAAVGGTLAIESAPGHGTSIEVLAPATQLKFSVQPLFDPELSAATT